MSRTVNNIAELAKLLQQEAIKAMQQPNSQTSKTVIETGKKHVDEDVYGVYSPSVYERTGELRESWEVENTSDGIAVFNTRHDDEKYVAETVETGRGYEYDFEYNGKPRPFIENTREELRNNNKLTQALSEDMRKSGFKIK